MKILRPVEKEYRGNVFQQRYIQTVKAEDALMALKENMLVVEAFFKNIAPEKLLFRYAEGKWTPLEILGHLIDTERILSYRALSAARNEKKPLLGFEEDDYVKATNFNKQRLSSLLLQYKTQRKSTLLLFKSFSVTELGRIAKANGYPTNARGLAWVIAGHELHHLNIINERYLSMNNG